MSNVTVSPVIVNPVGATANERKLSVIHSTSSQATLFALANEKGKMGAAVRSRLATGGAVGIAQQCASGNYRPLAEYLSAKTGNVTCISSRQSFESLPDTFTAMELTARKAKDGGMKIGKDGIEIPGPKLALALEMRGVVESCIQFAKDYHEARLAEKTAKTETAPALS